MTILPVVDALAWYLARLMGLGQHYLGLLISLFYRPNPVEKDGLRGFDFLISCILGGMMIFQARSPRDLPGPIADRMLMLGRLWLVIILVNVVQAALQKGWRAE